MPWHIVLQNLTEVRIFNFPHESNVSNNYETAMVAETQLCLLGQLHVSAKNPPSSG